MPLSRWKRGSAPRDFVRILDGKSTRVKQEIGATLHEAARRVKIEVDARTHIPKRLSKQDAPGGRDRALARRSPVRTRVAIGSQRSTATIELQPFYTRARTKGIEAIMRRFGLTNQLFRNSLIVRGRGRVQFRRNPGLRKWAEDPSKGYQIQRHVVHLSDLRARAALVLGPAVNASRPFVLGIWRKALREFQR